MSTQIRNDVRREVLNYFKSHTDPVRMSSLAEELRKNRKLRDLRDTDFLSIVQPMIATGKLSYTPELRIKLGTPHR